MGETRTLAQCWDRLAESPGSFLLLEATSRNLAEVVQRLSVLPAVGPGAAAAVVMQSELQPARWLLRQAGAVAVASNVPQLRHVARMAVRHLRLDADSPPPGSARAEIWRRLPWQTSTAGSLAAVAPTERHD